MDFRANVKFISTASSISDVFRMFTIQMAKPINHALINPFSVEVSRVPSIPGEGKPRRNAVSPDKLISFPPGATTLYENFLHGIRESGGGNFLGHRQVIKGFVGPYVWETYVEVQQRVENFGSGLIKQGLKPKDILGFFSKNNPECVIGELAGYQYNFISVPIYDALGVEAVKYVINQTKMKYCLATPSRARILLSVRKDLPTLKTIIVLSDDFEQELIDYAARIGVKVINFLVVERDGATQPVEAINPSPRDIAAICYTSGATGAPKGVVLTHMNFMSVVGSIHFLAERGKTVNITRDDVHMSYLSLAHVFERMNEAVIVYNGGAIGFYQGDMPKLLDDIAELKPTIFVSIPRMLNRICDKILASVNVKGGITRWMFNVAFNTKKVGLAKGDVSHRMWDRVLYGPIRAKLGGRVRIILSGSAPISSDVKDFLRICFSADVYEGYGQTENTCALTMTLCGDTSSGHVGPPQLCTEIKLVDVPEMNYTSNDEPYPRGEICVRGRALFKEYYKDPVKTAEVIDEGGWYHTGDVGMWDEVGRLIVVDRIRDFFKLSQGEYISPEKIEQVYEKHELVAQAFVHGDSLQAFLVAVIIPNRNALLQWARDYDGLCDYNYEFLCVHPQVKKYLLLTLIQFGKDNDLKGFENVKNIHLSSEQFSLQNDLLTPTLKLKRYRVKTKYQREIEAMYAEVS
ncbi:12976_t:CDS:2 [Acaulospora morrowiae]|uniref:12976_t:CDS:1 n=1 Tax=Acaulospora morrowiae TaxID=94023 RepID=A0A9N8VCA3_9GLOM|nr:12976_t:CDS:2 [Acaulospora morrowiae]